ncbi:MAG: hypothetical protein HYR96_15965 [Deltaproteobacteria bacterium]|nr:hypothetical protein [Deltaproteobacteria bacterium]MBI3293298.1 hypothetical protein [Deltaproteobacteria bacterium]
MRWSNGSILRQSAAASCVIWFLSACVSQPIKIEPSGLTVGAFEADQQKRQALPHFSAQVSFRLEGASGKVSGNGKLFAEPPKRFFLEVRDILGRSQLVMVLSGERFSAQYPQQKEFFEDGKGGSEFLSRFGLSLGLAEILALGVGALPRAWAIDRKSWEWSEPFYCFRAEAAGERYQVCVDGVNRSLTRVTRENGWTLEVQDFEPEPRLGFTLGRDLKFTERGHTLSLTWEEPPRLDGAISPTVFNVEPPLDFKRLPQN